MFRFVVPLGLAAVAAVSAVVVASPAAAVGVEADYAGYTSAEDSRTVSSTVAGSVTVPVLTARCTRAAAGTAVAGFRFRERDETAARAFGAQVASRCDGARTSSTATLFESATGRTATLSVAPGDVVTVRGRLTTRTTPSLQMTNTRTGLRVTLTASYFNAGVVQATASLVGAGADLTIRPIQFTGVMIDGRTLGRSPPTVYQQVTEQYGKVLLRATTNLPNETDFSVRQ